MSQKRNNNGPKLGINTFNKGMNKDVHPSRVPKGQYIEARNAVIDTEKGDFTYLSNEEGFSVLSSADSSKNNFIVIGLFSYNNRIVIFSIKPENITRDPVTNKPIGDIPTAESEIGYVNIENGTYTKVVNDSDPINGGTTKLNFDFNYPIRAAFRVTFNNEILCYFTDNKNSSRVINLDNPTNLISGNTFTDIDKQLSLSQKGNSPEIKYKDIIKGGSLKPGIYHFISRYRDEEENTTDFGILSQGAIITNDDETLVKEYLHDGTDFQDSPVGKSIRLDIKDIDQSYSFLELYVVIYSGAELTPEVYRFKDIAIQNTSETIIYNGKILNKIPSNKALEQTIVYDKAKYIEITKNRLFLANLENDEETDFQSIANEIRLKWKINDDYGNLTGKRNTDGSVHRGAVTSNKDAGIYNFPEATAQLKGYRRDEVYSFGLVFELKTGVFTEVYHIPAWLDTATHGNLTSSFDGGYDNNQDTYAGKTEGYFNCYVSEEKYNSDRYYGINSTNTQYNLQNTGIRHHLVPNNFDLPFYEESLPGFVKFNILLVKIENLATAINNHPQGDLIHKVHLVREQRNEFSKRRIYTMGSFNRFSYWDGTYYNNSGSGTNPLPPYNIKEYDHPFVSTIKPSPFFGNTLFDVWDPGDEGRAMCTQGLNIDTYGKGKDIAHRTYLWHSPETILLKNFTIPNGAQLSPVSVIETDLNDNISDPINNPIEISVPSWGGSIPAKPYGSYLGDFNLNTLEGRDRPFIIQRQGNKGKLSQRRFTYGHYDFTDSATFNKTRGFLFHFHGDFTSEPIVWHPQENANLAVWNGYDVPITNSYYLQDNKPIINPESTQGLIKAHEEEYINMYGVEPGLVLESGLGSAYAWAHYIGDYSNSYGWQNQQVLREGANITPGNSTINNVTTYFSQRHADIRVCIGADHSNRNYNDITVPGEYQVISQDNTVEDNIGKIRRTIYNIKNNLTDQYGKLDSNEYIYVDSFSTDTNDTEAVGGGDTYIGEFYYKTSCGIEIVARLADETPEDFVTAPNIIDGPMSPGLLSRPGGVCSAGNTMYVESDVNCDLRYTPVERDINTKEVTKSGVPYYPRVEVWEALAPVAELGHSDGYNPEYNKECDFKKYFLPGENFIKVYEYSNRIIYSEKHLEEEKKDQHRKFFSASYHDIPKSKGEITDIFTIGNSFFIHAERSLFKSFVNENTSLQSNSGDEVYMGDSGVFARESQEMFEIDAGYGGTIHDFANANSPYGRFFVDAYNKKIFIFDGQKVREISNLGLRKFFEELDYYEDNNPVDSRTNYIIGWYDPLHRRYIITFNRGYDVVLDPNGVQYYLDKGITVSYNVLTESWTSFHDYYPNFVVNNDIESFSINNLIAFHPNSFYLSNAFSIHRHNLGFPGIYYLYKDVNDITLPILKYPFEIEYVSNDEPTTNKIFDTYLLELESYDKDTDNYKLNTCFDYLSAYTKHKYTDIITILAETETYEQDKIDARYINDSWQIQVPLSATIDENSNLFDSNNYYDLTDALTPYDRPRMIGKYLISKFTYNNSENIKHSLASIITKYRYHFR